MKHHHHYFSLTIPSKTALLDKPKAGTVAPSGSSDDCWMEKKKKRGFTDCHVGSGFKGHRSMNPCDNNWDFSREKGRHFETLPTHPEHTPDKMKNVTLQRRKKAFSKASAQAFCHQACIFIPT